VAVSKRHPASALRQAYDVGQRDFGESYVQEMVRKADALSDLSDIRFHMIGHLQRNKVRHVVPVASAVHTVDSVRLATELGERSRSAPVPPARAWYDDDSGRLPVFVEVNVGGEAQKSGCAPSDLGEVLDAVEAAPALRLTGLMTVPPHTERAAESRRWFDALVALRDALGGAARLAELSMGMSHDLEHAIVSGATVVRVGTAIFGPRD
jgi:pyridoxal phosphate enzyme (YggS family)